MSRFIVCIVTQYFQEAKQRYLPRKVWRQKSLRSFLYLQVFKIHLLFSAQQLLVVLII